MIETPVRPSTPVRDHSSLALWTFVAAIAIAAVVLIGSASRSWFGFDDWDFLAARTAGDLNGLFEPHGDHWSTLPILLYRLLWELFGLRFTPYVVVAVAFHLGTAVLLRVVMRRASVDPWIATAAASLYALFGVGFEMTVNLFALAFGMPLLLGLSHLLLADHDGPWDRRDWLGVLAGLGAIASSVVGVPMVLAVGVATWARRGLRIALLHVVPLAVIYVAWYLTFAEQSDRAGPGDVVRFVQTAIRGVLVDLGQSWPLAVVLGVVLVVGFTLAWGRPDSTTFRRVASMPLGLLFGLIGFLVATGWARSGSGGATFGDLARLSHYMAVAAVMILPALAFAASAIANRYRPLLPVLAVLFVIGIPGNLVALQDGVERSTRPLARDVMLWLPRAPGAESAPVDLTPEPLLAAPVTIGWLVDALADGRVPEPGRDPTEDEVEQLELRLSVWQTDGMRVLEPCERTPGPVERELEAWSDISLGPDVQVNVSVLTETGWSPPVTFGQPFTTQYARRLGQSLTPSRAVRLRFTSASGAPFQICG